MVDLESKVAALVKAQVPKKSASKSENPEFLEAGFVGTILEKPLNKNFASCFNTRCLFGKDSSEFCLVIGKKTRTWPGASVGDSFGNLEKGRV